MNPGLLQHAVAQSGANPAMTVQDIAAGIDALMRSALCNGIPVQTPGYGGLVSIATPLVAGSNGSAALIGQAWASAILSWVPTCFVPGAVPPAVIPGPAVAALAWSLAGVYASWRSGLPQRFASSVTAALGSCTAIFIVGPTPTPFPLV